MCRRNANFLPFQFSILLEEYVLKIWFAKTIKEESDDVAVMNALWGNGVLLIVQRVSPFSYFLVLSIPWESFLRLLRAGYRNTEFKMLSYIFFILNYEHSHLWRVELSKEKKRPILLLVYQPSHPLSSNIRKLGKKLEKKDERKTFRLFDINPARARSKFQRFSLASFSHAKCDFSHFRLRTLY